MRNFPNSWIVKHQSWACHQLAYISSDQMLCWRWELRNNDLLVISSGFWENLSALGAVLPITGFLPTVASTNIIIPWVEKHESRGSITYIISQQILCWRWESKKCPEVWKLEVREVEKIFGYTSL